MSHVDLANKQVLLKSSSEWKSTHCKKTHYIQVRQCKVYTKLDINYFSVSMNAVSCLDLLEELSLHG